MSGPPALHQSYVLVCDYGQDLFCFHAFCDDGGVDAGCDGFCGGDECLCAFVVQVQSAYEAFVDFDDVG